MVFTLKYFVVYVAIIILSFLVSRNILHLVLNYDSAIERRRKSQMAFKNEVIDLERKKEDNLLGKISEKLFEAIEIPENNRTKLTNKLILADWNMTPEDYYTASILSVLGGIVAALFVYVATGNLIVSIVILIGCSGLMHFLCNNEINNRKFSLLSEFPTFIQMTEGFLVSGLPLVKAIEKTLPYLGETWKPIIKLFVVASETRSQEECIKYIKSLVPIFEVQEFWSLVQLANEQGIDVQECFESQTTKIHQIQRENIMSKINKRKIMATFVQFPLLICMMVGFALPTVGGIMEFL